MKVFQVNHGFCFKDYTYMYKTSEAASQNFAPNIEFVEAPDYVFEGWGYNPDATGDSRFIKPIAPEGWIYNEETGTFENIIELKKAQILSLKQLLLDTDYIIIKCYELFLVGQTPEYDIEQVHAERQAIRDQINALEAELEG